MKSLILVLAFFILYSPVILGEEDLIFEDDFETSDTSRWSASEGVVTVPLDGFGLISGPCGFLGFSNIDSSSPWIFANSIDFGLDPYDDSDLDQLTAGGQEIINAAGSGGSSVLAEAFAFEILARCELAALLKTGDQIIYIDPLGAVTDMTVEVDYFELGVMATRAVAYPFDDPYTVEQASNLLTSKLEDINASSANVAAEDAWRKQILAVLAYGSGHRDSLLTAWDQLDASLKVDTIVIVTVTDGDDSFIY